MLLTGCGSSPSFDFSDKDLSYAAYAEESLLDKLSLQPTEKNVIQKYSNIDEYVYAIKKDAAADSKEVFRFTTKDDVVCGIRLKQYGGTTSEYNLFGIHAGDSREMAVALAQAYFDEEGTWTNIAGIESVSYGEVNGRKGNLTLIFNSNTETVDSLDYRVEPK